MGEPAPEGATFLKRKAKIQRPIMNPKSCILWSVKLCQEQLATQTQGLSLKEYVVAVSALTTSSALLSSPWHIFPCRVLRFSDLSSSLKFLKFLHSPFASLSPLAFASGDLPGDRGGAGSDPSEDAPGCALAGLGS